MSKLDTIERAAKSALDLAGEWSPEGVDYEGGGRFAAPRVHTLQDADGCQDIDGEDEAADTDVAFLQEANPQTVLAMIEVIRAAIQMRKGGMGTDSEQADVFDEALAKLEGGKP
jgi:hypothetical protein